MKILVTSKSFGQYDPSCISLLEQNGFEVRRSDVPNPSAADIRRQIPGCTALVVGNDPVDRSVIDAGDSLKLIHMHGSGLDAIDMTAAVQRGIYVANVPGANKNAVAELTVLLMLSLGRGLAVHIDLLRRGEWKRYAGRELTGSTVGVIGLGNIGRRVVELISGFTVSVCGYDPHADKVWAADHRVKLACTSDEVFKNADWVILTLPLTEETRHIVNSRTLALMKPTAYLINTARGGLVDEQALCRAIGEKRIAGAALDAFAEEPPSMDSPLRGAGILMTPHIAATSIETAALVSRRVSQNIIDVIINKKTDCVVNAAEIQFCRRK